jgi:hypothetical protein
MTTTTQPLTTVAEVMGDNGVIVYANGPILISWNRRATLRAYDTMHKRAAGDTGGWGWTEYDLVAEFGPDDSDLGVHMDLAWAMDKAAEWYDDHEEEF